jgi:hypothetical protein
VEPGPDRSLGRRLVAIGAAALVVSLVARALSNELDISPAVTILIVWAVLTVLFAGFVWLRGRQVDGDDEDDAG